MYAWIITRDHLTELENEGEVQPSSSDVGRYGPSNVTDELKARLDAGEGEEFRLLDDDGELNYEGRIIDPSGNNAFAPLDDFGKGWAGCTSVHYLDNGVWSEL